VKYPDAVLFSQWRGSSDGAKGDLFTGAFHFQRISGFKMQLLAQRLGNDDAPGLIDNEMAIHCAI
jgi:hypothetical protein